jgi:L-asparaginase/Glu-tRNA(Gln) amidotransferase subunit D
VKPRIAVFSGPTATIQNSPPLVTSGKARTKYGLPPLFDGNGATPRFDVLRAQRLAAPVTVYIEQFSAHPLEREAAELYAPPDGYVDSAGTFSKERRNADDVPVYEVTLEPGDGLYPLPYMGRQADGSAWDDAFAAPFAPSERSRQTFYPDASRIFEEIDRLGVGERGMGGTLAALAEFDFFRPAPSGGYRKGLPAAERSDRGDGDIAPEVWGEDFFMYYPMHLRKEPSQQTLARATNVVAAALASGEYSGGLWLEGSPTAEESIYWLNLLIDTRVPLVAHSAQRAHGLLSADGDRNIVDGVKYIASRIWAGSDGADAVGGVMIVDELIYTARDVQKGDARPGGYVATGGHGGLLGSANPPKLMFTPAKRHTFDSETNLSRIPASVPGVRRSEIGAAATTVTVKNAAGELLPEAMPKVTIEKYGRYLIDHAGACRDDEVGIMARIARNLDAWPLSGFVGEGMAPYGALNESEDQALTWAVLHGMPVVKVGRGNADGVTPRTSELFISGDNLTATKARILLMACLLRFGALPPVADPASPSDDELRAIKAKVADYQAVFDTH